MEGRAERHLMRQRGVGARELKSGFGFTFAVVNNASAPPRSSPRRVAPARLRTSQVLPSQGPAPARLAAQEASRSPQKEAAIGADIAKVARRRGRPCKRSVISEDTITSLPRPSDAHERLDAGGHARPAPSGLEVAWTRTDRKSRPAAGSPSRQKAEKTRVDTRQETSVESMDAPASEARAVRSTRTRLAKSKIAYAELDEDDIPRRQEPPVAPRGGKRKLAHAKEFEPEMLSMPKCRDLDGDKGMNKDDDESLQAVPIAGDVAVEAGPAEELACRKKRTRRLPRGEPGAAVAPMEPRRTGRGEARRQGDDAGPLPIASMPTAISTARNPLRTRIGNDSRLRTTRTTKLASSWTKPDWFEASMPKSLVQDSDPRLLFRM